MTAKSTRVDWVDTAKGFCIIFVVMMHSTLGVGEAAGGEGWMHYLVAFAKPFRMPDFFLISGLFLANVIDRDWRLYLDRKVVHFAYFYALWVTIQFAVKAPLFAEEMGWGGVAAEYAWSFVQPFGTLWFIYLLPVMFIVAKAARSLQIPWPLMLAVAAGLQIAPIETGWLVVDEFCARFVFFYSGYVFAPNAFALAAWARTNLAAAGFGLVVWAVANGTLVFQGDADLPFVSLFLGAIGAFAVIVLASMLTEIGLSAPLRYCGENSIVVYLAFFFPMAVSRIVLLKLGIITDIGTISVLVTAAGVIGPLLLWWAIRKVGLGYFLFRRPHWAFIDGRRPGAAVPQAAE
ncbi:acyltransferase family protein [Stappia sp. F7233]|uniref:Acyltransferase family protein n=1 Tax=Stappia albiluteola TaxID=2758565 RepID=A0A839AIF9_9HYPH|nr:acyltransferase family protein [Stappia albiluteola]MBA5778808.1 acyltransferase family protein [Stappia albiluteola]